MPHNAEPQRHPLRSPRHRKACAQPAEEDLQPLEGISQGGQKGRNNGFATWAPSHFGEYGLKCDWPRSSQTARQIKPRASMTLTSSAVAVWIRIFRHAVVAEPPRFAWATARQSVVLRLGDYTGRVLSEIDGVTEVLAREAFAARLGKLPISDVSCIVFWLKDEI